MMSLIKTLILFFLLALSLNMAACATTAQSKSESGGAMNYGVQGAITRDNSGKLPWDAYWGP